MDNIPCVPSKDGGGSMNGSMNGGQTSPMDLLSKLTSFNNPSLGENNSSSGFSSLLEQLQNSMGATPPPAKKVKSEQNSGRISESDFAALIGQTLPGNDQNQNNMQTPTVPKLTIENSKLPTLPVVRSITPPSDSKTLLSSLTAAIQANQQANQQAQQQAHQQAQQQAQQQAIQQQAIQQTLPLQAPQPTVTSNFTPTLPQPTVTSPTLHSSDTGVPTSGGSDNNSGNNSHNTSKCDAEEVNQPQKVKSPETAVETTVVSDPLAINPTLTSILGGF